MADGGGHQEGVYARWIGFMLVPKRCDLVRGLVGQDKSYVMLARARRRILARARARLVALALARLRLRSRTPARTRHRWGQVVSVTT